MSAGAGRGVVVRVEVPKGSFVKRDAAGRAELRSPVPCPFNYGTLEGVASADGDGADAVLLGPRRAAGARVEAEIWGVVRFTDGGLPDDKWVCAAAPPGPAARRAVRAFFVLYAWTKRLRGGAAQCGAWEAPRRPEDVSPSHNPRSPAESP
jgi:inorganic pyrophosphatase